VELAVSLGNVEDLGLPGSAHLSTVTLFQEEHEDTVVMMEATIRLTQIRRKQPGGVALVTRVAGETEAQEAPTVELDITLASPVVPGNRCVGNQHYPVEAPVGRKKLATAQAVAAVEGEHPDAPRPSADIQDTEATAAWVV
jgi:hypothetical protein